MLSLGFRPQLELLLDSIQSKHQSILFSATLNEEVEPIIEKFFQLPEYIEVITRGTPLEKIIQTAYEVPNFYTKVNLLKWLLLNENGFTKVLLFVKNKTIADQLEKVLSDSITEIGIIHSNKSQPQRFNAVKQFQEGAYRLLIATDLMARGLDLKDVTHVINFDLPKDDAGYLHRIGRTGRADKIGTAITFLTPHDKPARKEIEKMMNKKITLLSLANEVLISDELTYEEMPVTRDKNLAKQKRLAMPTGAFHEKKAKNKKVQLGGKRRQEKQRRAIEKSRAKRKR